MSQVQHQPRIYTATAFSPSNIWAQPDITVYTNDLDSNQIHRLAVIAAKAYNDSKNQVLGYLSCGHGLVAITIYMEILIRLTLKHGWVVCWDDPEVEGGITTAWFVRPGDKIGIWEQVKQLRNAAKVTGWGLNFVRLLFDLVALEASHQRAMQVIKRRMGSTMHLYALSFASLPGGRGGLSRILKPVLAWCQQHRLPCYLEAADEANARLYMYFEFQALWNIELVINWLAQKFGMSTAPLVYPAMIWWPASSP